MDINEFLTEIYTDAQHNPFPFSLERTLAQYIYDATDETSKTLETGAGLSTVIFALKGTQHTCVTPDKNAVVNMLAYCKQKNISVERIDFQIQRSEDALPHLQLKDLDLVLIDGRHAFPTPFIDWYYASSGLKNGGILIIDDTNVWTGKILEEFLCLEAEWQLVKRIRERAVIFIKKAGGGHAKEFHQQPFVMLKSVSQDAGIPCCWRAAHQALGLLYNGKILTLIQKIIYRIRLYYYYGPQRQKKHK
ncbi:MAG: class I SAM-dependent methyltransferase [Candidatus Omnitrophica bacterium]|nr:class I SAM-dependent methyltransferase [Candidatus Omnitrophota bacterium]